MADEKFIPNMSECPFRANLEKIKKEGVVVIRNSQGKIEEHREFKHSYNINFELISDPALEVVRGLVAYEKENFIRKGILVDDKGHIIKEWKPLKIEEETEDFIRVIRSLLIGGSQQLLFSIKKCKKVHNKNIKTKSVKL